MKPEKVVEMARLLLEQEEYLSSDDIAVQIGMSRSSVRNLTAELEDFLEKNGLRLERKRGVGFRITGDKENAHNLRYAHCGGKDISFREYRRMQLLLLLLDDSKSYKTFSALAERLSVSGGTVQADLEHLKSCLAGHAVQLETSRGKGIRLAGNEDALRDLFSQSLGILNRMPGYARFFYPFEKPLSLSSLLQVDTDRVSEIVKQAYEGTGLTLSSESLENIVMHIAIVLSRVRSGNEIERLFHEPEILNKAEYAMAVDICRTLEKQFSISLNTSEVYYLYLLLVSAKVVLEDKSIEKITREIQSSDVFMIADEIIKVVQQLKYLEDISETCRINLAIHLKATLNRLAHGIVIANPVIETIHNEYSEAYGIAWMMNPLFQKNCSVSLNEPEAGYIALHIQNLIEMGTRKMSAVIVCNSGVGISQLLFTQLQERCTNLNILRVESSEAFLASTALKPDFVVATMLLDTDTPVILVNPILTQDDIDNINTFIGSHSTDGFEAEQYLDIAVFAQQQLTSQKQIIEFVGLQLRETEHVSERFEASIYEREAINSTAIGMGVALPHSGFEVVHRSCVAIVTLPEPVLWGENDLVDLVFFVVLRKDDVRKATIALRKIYYRLYSTDSHKQIVESSDAEEIKTLIFRKGHSS